MVLKAGRVLDASTAQDFIDGGACALSTNPFLVCDLSETVFLTSAGLSALARLRTLAFSLQGEVRVAGCSEDTLQVIKKSHFDRDIPLYNTFSKAIVA
jgi:anti-anti-sigma regulatory factor